MLPVNLVNWLTDEKRRSAICTRAGLISLFSSCEVERIPDQPGNIVVGTQLVVPMSEHKESKWKTETSYVLVRDKNFIYTAICRMDADKPVLDCICAGKVGQAPLHPHESFVLEEGMIPNYTAKSSITTTVGRYITNWMMLAEPFGNVIPYINTQVSIDKIQSQIAKHLLNKVITTSAVDKYMNNSFFLGVFAELIVAGFSEKSIIPNPEIKKKKEELLKQYKEELENNDTDAAVTIEDKLIALDKEYLKGDPSMGFYGSSSKKFNVHRKSQYLAVGMLEKFQKDRGEYTFVDQALVDGWRPEDFVTITNEIRKGIYSRGIETEQGGVQTKKLMGMFQNTTIKEDDCGSKNYYTVHLTEENYDSYLGYYAVVPGTSHKLEALDISNKTTFINKTVNLRCALFCKTKAGFCFTCVGDTYRKLGSERIGADLLEIGAALLTASMKAMHGTKLSSIRVTDIDTYVV